DAYAQVGGAFHQVLEQIAGPVGSYLVDDIVESLNPFSGFLRVEVIGGLYSWFKHAVLTGYRFPAEGGKREKAGRGCGAIDKVDGVDKADGVHRGNRGPRLK